MQPGTRIGTSFFVSRSALLRYYVQGYGFSVQEVDVKLRAGEVHVGKPFCQPDERLEVDKADGRYIKVITTEQGS